MSIYIIGINFRNNILECREKYSYTKEYANQIMSMLIKQGYVNEIVYLKTCNRVEYIIYSKNYTHIIHNILFPSLKYSNLTIYKGWEVSLYLFRVVSGLESQIIGENEILRQIKKSYYNSLNLGFTSTNLNILMHKVISVGKLVRSITNISRYSLSLGGIIIDFLYRSYKTSEILKYNYLFIGLGEISISIIKTLKKKGINNIVTTNLNKSKGLDIARKLGVDYFNMNKEDLYKNIEKSQVIIAATSSNSLIITKAEWDEYFKDKLPYKKFMFDLSLPRNIDNTIEDSNNQIFNIDTIKYETNKNATKRQVESDKVNILISVQNYIYINDYLHRQRYIKYLIKREVI